MIFFFFSSRRRHTRCSRDWSSDVCSSDLKRQDSPVVFEQCDRLPGRVERQAPAPFRARDPVGFLRVDERVFEQAELELRQIGRASCRGKSVDLGGRRIIKKKKKRAVWHCT